MTQVAENVESVWNMNSTHREYNDVDLELRQNAKELVEEITDALRSTRNIYNDRGTIESALKEALESCSYPEDQSYREVYRKNRKESVEYVYLSTTPVYWDELELDQEINLLEEEIARLEEQKLLLKRSSSISSIDSNSDLSSLSQNSSSADEHSEDEDRFLLPLASATKRISKVDLRQNKNQKRRKISDEEEKKSKSKKNQKKTVNLKVKFQEDLMTPSKNIGSSVNSLESTSSSISSPSKKSIEKRKQTEQIFKVEQVLKLSPVVSTDDNEDEDIDILN